MRFLLLVVVLAGLTALASADGWQLVWSDEFNGGAVNTTEWHFETGCSQYNDELECYTPNRHENARIENGALVIDVRVEEYENHHFTSSRMISQSAWTYGKFVARARLTSGHNLWPAIWMMPKDSKYGQWAASGEIDIMEQRGDKPHEVMGTIHYGGTAPNNIYHGSGERSYPQDFSDDFHTFGMEWNSNEISWFVDDVKYHTENINKSMWSGKGPNPYTKNGQPFDQPFFWILNVAVGGNFFGGPPYVTPQEARSWKKHTMEIDYVHVYQWK